MRIKRETVKRDMKEGTVEWAPPPPFYLPDDPDPHPPDNQLNAAALQLRADVMHRL